MGIMAFPADEQTRVETFDQFCERHGCPRTPPSHPEMHRYPRRPPKSVQRAAEKRVLAEGEAWEMKRRDLERRYNNLIADGEIRPPSHRERMRKVASGHADNPSVQAARRVLKERYNEVVE